MPFHCIGQVHASPVTCMIKAKVGNLPCAYATLKTETHPTTEQKCTRVTGIDQPSEVGLPESVRAGLCLLLPGPPKLLESLRNALPENIQLQEAQQRNGSKAQGSHSQSTQERRRLGDLGSIVGDNVVQRDVAVHGERHAEGQIHRHGHDSRALNGQAQGQEPSSRPARLVVDLHGKRIRFKDHVHGDFSRHDA